MMTKALAVLGFVSVTAMAGSPAFSIEPAMVDDAKYVESVVAGNGSKEPNALILKLQIMLDRAHFSPGVIDGRLGDNTVYALREFEKRSGLPVDGRLDRETWSMLSQSSPNALVTYTVTAKDISGPFADSVPDDYAAMAEMESLSFTSAAELLSEKFHIDIELLKSLNPRAGLDKAGEKIVVPNVVDAAPEGELERIEIDKGQGVLRGSVRMALFLWFIPPLSAVARTLVQLER